MRSFEGKNFYEILNLPLRAGLIEINQAYTEALEMYDEDALATYALFTDEQQKSLLQAIGEAFQTLSNREKRTEYDQMLISTGQVEAAAFSDHSRHSLTEQRKDQISSEPGGPTDAMAQHSKGEKIRELMNAISQKDLVSGEDLKELREARGIDIDEIFQRTRISKTTLQRIEQNQCEDLPAEIFLKSFLKSYAEILGIDPKNIVDGYLKHKAIAE